MSLFRRRNKLLSRQGQLDFHRDYTRIVGLLEHCPGENNLVGKTAFLDFSIKVLCRELEAEDTALFLRRGVDRSEDGFGYIPAEAQTTRSNVPLAPYCVIARPYDDRKMARAVYSEFKHGHRADMTFSEGVLYEELGLVIIENSRHHNAVAKLKKQGFANCLDVVSLAEYFDTLETNGSEWRSTSNRQLRVTPCPDYRMALLYALAKKRHDLSQGFENTEPQAAADSSNASLAEPWPQNRLMLREMDDMIHVQKNELEMLRRHIDRLQRVIRENNISVDLFFP